MILKEFDPLCSSDPLTQSGRVAEERMAFYLRRSFANNKEIFVLNDLRLELDGEAAQIDHLLFYRYGIFVVESKSVTTSVEINEQGEWIRWYAGNAQGMPSPIEQAWRQVKFLKDYLRHHIEQLRPKILGVQMTYGGMATDIFVAISDTAIIQRKAEFPEVCKAEQVCRLVQARIQTLKRANSLLTPGSPFDLKDVYPAINKRDLERVSQFLLEHHKPPRSLSTSDAEAQVSPTTAVLSSTAVKSVPMQCAVCGKELTPAVAQYCHRNSLRFEGKLYCMIHQKAIRTEN